jgi:pimeloyl-ACP methyl ester carboxylesterase
MAMAAAADSKYTLEVLDDLTSGDVPILLVWGEDDEFQPVRHAARFAADAHVSAFERIRAARHIPTVDAPDAVAQAIVDFLRAG